MIGIGEFSRSTGMSIATLRHYDEAGVLRPAHVDEFNGYRFYSAPQMQQAGLLRVLRAAGIRVDDMRRVLEHPNELDGLIESRKDEIARQRLMEDWALSAAAGWNTEIDLGVVKKRTRPARRWVAVEAELSLRDATDFESVSEAEEAASQLEIAGEELSEIVGGSHLPEGVLDSWVRLSLDSKKLTVFKAAIGLEVPYEIDLPKSIAGIPVLQGTFEEATEAYIRCTVAEETSPSNLGTAEAPPAELPGGPLPSPELTALQVFCEKHGEKRQGWTSLPIFQRVRDNSGALEIEYSVILD